ncbi:MAG: hypothetical protein HFJ33_00195 [Clostridia bacterium]|nr:hypothetical protein [Clostridia bacterium]
MYHETYEEYIRSILGYPNYQNNNMVENNYPIMPTTYQNQEQNMELETCYPEIYKVVYPMVNKACITNTKPITPELIDDLTNEIYLSIENDNEINVNINLTNEVANHVSIENRSKASSVATTNSDKIEKTRENRGEDRQFRNRGLQDLIRILLIRELLGRPGNRPPRPHFPPNRPPMRPPFPGGPRPPIMPRYQEFSEFYEE